MLDRGVGLARLSVITGYSRSHISNVINGNESSLVAKRLIAAALAKDFEELWVNDERDPRGDQTDGENLAP